MKKSHLIALIVLLAGVSVLVWIGAFSGSGIKDGNKPQGTVNSGYLSQTTTPEPTAPSTAKPTEKPVVTEKPIDIDSISVYNADFSKYANEFQVWDSYFTMDAEENQNYPYVKKAIVDHLGDAKIIPGVVKNIEVDGVTRYIISNAHVESEQEVYLTFSLAYDSPVVVNKLLDILADKNVKATFFMTDYYIEAEGNAEVIKRIYSSGHLIGTRGPDEEFLKSCTAETFAKRLKDSEKIFRTIVGDNNARMLYYRPEIFSERTLMVAAKLGYKNVFRTFVTEGANNWLNDIVDSDGDLVEDLVCTKLFERGSYDGSVPDLKFNVENEDDRSLLIRAFTRYLDEAKSANITFKLLNQ